VGRMAGISNSDVSSYTARVLFYNNIGVKTNNMRFFGSAFWGFTGAASQWMANKFRSAGYNAWASTSEEDSYEFNFSEWENQDLIFYLGHGSSRWAGIYYLDIPKLTNSLVIAATCATADKFNYSSFWAYSIRRGSTGFIGAVSTTFLTTSALYTLNGIYYSDKDLGNAFKDSYVNDIFQAMVILIGDPTFRISPEKRLAETIVLDSDALLQILAIEELTGESIFCENTQTNCGLQGNCKDCTVIPPTELVCNFGNTKIMGKYYTCMGSALGCMAQPIRKDVEICNRGCSEIGGAHCRTCVGTDNNCGSKPDDTKGCALIDQQWTQSHKGKGCNIDTNACYDSGWNSKQFTQCPNICENGECTCKADGIGCVRNKACCSASGCREFACGLKADGQGCVTHGACSSNRCVLFACGLQRIGKGCTLNADCSSNKCRWFTCRA